MFVSFEHVNTITDKSVFFFLDSESSYSIRLSSGTVFICSIEAHFMFSIWIKIVN